jgi:steroid delta-isomerase-like uncharacterized protein
MPIQNNEKLAREMFAAVNERRIDDAMKNVTDKLEWKNAATGEIFRGPSGARQFIDGWLRSFDDLKIDIKRIIANDREVVAEFVARGTHTGPLNTPAGEIPATNRKVELPCCEIATIENGKIHKVVTYMDTLTMLGQLGVVEEHAGSNR